MDWYTITVNILLPAGAVLILFFLKRKLLWLAPFLSSALTIAVSLLAMPSILTDNEHAAFFWRLILPLHLAVALQFTVIGYVVAYVLRKRANKD